MKNHLKTVSKNHVATAATQLSGASILEFIIGVLGAVNSLLTRKHAASS